MPAVHNKFLALGLVCVLLAACGGGGSDGSGTTPLPDGDGLATPAAALTQDDLLGLYPEFFLSMVGGDFMLMEALGSENPFLDQAPDCPPGSVTQTTQPDGSVQFAYDGCNESFSTAGLPGVEPMTVTFGKKGVITYRLISSGGDYTGAREAFDLDYTANFEALTLTNRVEKETALPVEIVSALTGAMRWTHRGTDLFVTKGEVDVRSDSYGISSTVRGRTVASQVTDVLTTWQPHADRMIRMANLTLRLSDGRYADKQIHLRNLVPAVLDTSLPDLTLEQDDAEISLFAQAISGIDLLSYGVSKVYAIYERGGMTLETDLDGNDCIERAITVTTAQLEAAIVGQTPLDGDQAVSFTQCRAPRAG